MDTFSETNPIYEAVCRDLRYRPKETRISVTFKADVEQFKNSMQMMEIMTGSTRYYIPNVKLDLGDGA